MDRRAHRRVPAQLQGFLLGNSHEIEAVTLDLSIGGARFDCDLEVYPGKMIRVRLVIPGAEGPVSIDDARVQWVGEDMFGVSFRNVRLTELDELEQLVDEFEMNSKRPKTVAMRRSQSEPYLSTAADGLLTSVPCSA